MSVITPPTPSIVLPDAAPEDVLAMDGLFELVDGRLVEKHLSFKGGKTATKVISVLNAFIEKHHLGELVPEITFKCFPQKPEQIRRPDIAFIKKDRLGDVPEEGYVPVRPDLVIEIMSPGDEVYYLEEKLRDYKSAGIPLIWILNPEQRLARIYQAGRLKAELEEDEQLNGDPVLPGFAVRVGDLFPAVSPATL